MNANYQEYMFSDLIEEVEERNTSLEYGLDDIVGVTIEKGLIPTIANLTQTALDKFYIVKPDTFVYNPRTHGVRLGMGYNDTNKIFLTSWNNVAFRVKEDAKKIVLSKYLWIYFNRPEWDRQTNFMAWGSSTIVFAWNDFLSIKIKLPNLKEQEKIVNTYNAITKRIQLKQKINENLEKTAQTIYKKMFVENADENWKKCELGEIVEIKRGGSPRPISDYMSNDGYRWLKISDATSSNSPFIFKTEEFIKKEGLKNTVYLKSGSLVLSNSATPGLPKILKVDTCIHDGWLYFPKSFFSNEYLYLLFQSIRDELRSLGNGSIFTNLKTDILKEYKILISDKEKLNEFQRIINPIFKQLFNTSKEIEKLELFKQSVISRISGM